MPSYSGLDKINTEGLILVEKYEGASIYNCVDEGHDCVNPGYAAVKRGFCIDSQFNTIEGCREVIDWFNTT